MDTEIILKDTLQVCPQKTRIIYTPDIFKKEFKKIRMSIRKLKIRRLFFN